MPFGYITKANDVLGTIQEKAEPRNIPQKNPMEFLDGWVKDNLPDAVINIATKVAGRDDGSGLLGKMTMEMGEDPNVGEYIDRIIPK